ncbi:LMBR1 domain-containing 2-like protein A [Micractinium conductrix]|uniref:LMBR1 domain-containing 2-like protein A n=1 Tax=Micractinium conductrix TaxID=554055 RepID=A0A2P6VIQ1_9CHLO|nr:LMBR1 domain-containing 2-like protein A [Micractinium conductrix]|eukprot:PSC73983.1 LMBR1 domain-containing 2-like protein A [Micractinium conductrix]
MLFFYLFTLPLVACAAGWALLWLPSRSTGWGVRLDVGLAWFAALAAVVLVPADVAAALTGRPNSQLAVWWRAAYWYGFLAQVAVLPLHMEFARSGEFSVKARLLAAARTNLLYYAILLGVGLAGLVLLLFSGRLQPANVLGFCIAFSNAYGLVAAIFLLGFGLVAVPRQLWNTADPCGGQRRVCHKAGLQAERAQAAHRRLTAAVLAARRASALFAPHDPLRPLMDAVLALANSTGRRFVLDSSVPEPEEVDLDIFDRSDLARLRRELKAALKDWEREQALYAEAVEEHLHLQRVVAKLQAGPPEGAPLRQHLAWLWQCHGHFWAYRLLAALAALCSLAIVVAEATIAGALPNLSVVSAALHATSGASQFLTELLCFAFLAYPCACAYYSLYRLGRFAFYRMVPRHTDAYSLCYSGLLMCRFAAPLAFNFMAAIALPESKDHDAPDVTDTVFYAEFGQLMMRQPLIGWQFTTFAPALLVPYMLLLASGAFRHAASLFKRGEQLEFEDDWQNDSYAAMGRRMLAVESENARNGLPPGLTIEPAAAGGAPPPASAGAGLLGGLREAAAAAAVEQAAEEAAARRGGSWWARLLPGGAPAGGGGGGGDGGAQQRSVEAARGRLTRLLIPTGGAGEAGGRRGAGYTALPSSAADASPLVRTAPGGIGGGGRHVCGVSAGGAGDAPPGLSSLALSGSLEDYADMVEELAGTPWEEVVDLISASAAVDAGEAGSGGAAAAGEDSLPSLISQGGQQEGEEEEEEEEKEEDQQGRRQQHASAPAPAPSQQQQQQQKQQQQQQREEPPPQHGQATAGSSSGGKRRVRSEAERLAPFAWDRRKEIHPFNACKIMPSTDRRPTSATAA